MKAVTGDDNVAPCTFAQGLLEDGNNSAVFAFVQATHLEKCRRGAATNNKKRDEAALTYHVHIQAGLTDEQALDCIKYEMGDEYHNLAVGYLKFCWMVKLAVQLERKEEIDMVEVVKFTSLVGMEVEDLMKNAEACMEGRAKAFNNGIKELIDLKHIAAVIVRGGIDISNLKSLESMTFVGDDKITFDALSTSLGTELLKKLQDVREQCLKQYKDSDVKLSNDLRRIAAAIVNDGTDITKLRTRALRRITFMGDNKIIFDALSIKFDPAELLKKLQDVRKEYNDGVFKELIDLKSITAELSDLYDISALDTLPNVTLTGKTNKVFSALRSRFGDIELLKKLKEFHIKKREETRLIEFDTSKKPTLGFKFSESKSGTLLFTLVEKGQLGEKAGLKKGMVIKSINGEKWRGKGDSLERMEECMGKAYVSGQVKIEVFGSNAGRKRQVN